MKRIFTLALAGLMIFALAACGETESVSTPTPAAAPDAAPAETPAGTEAATSTETPAPDGDGGVLVAYFSWSGNTEALANMIQAETGGELFEITPAEPYTGDYDELLDIARDEQSENARPSLASAVENWDGCDTVFVGYPDWWGDAPMLIYSFLESYDWTGKTLVPFCTSGGSGFGRSLSKLPDSAPGADILDGLHIRSGAVEGSESEVAEWIASLGI